MNSKQKKTIDDVRSKLLSLATKKDDSYTETDRKVILESIALLDKYKSTCDQSLLLAFVVSLLKAYLRHELISLGD